MEKDTIITLEDNTEYGLLDDTVIDGRKFFFAVKVDKNGNPLTEYEVFEEEVEDGDTYMTVLEDGDFKQAILIDFTNNYMNMVGSIMENNEESASVN